MVASFLGRRLRRAATGRSVVQRCLQHQVVINGGGPSGLTAALLLCKYGVPCTLVEPLETPSRHPRAHVLSARTMEIMREVGVESSVMKACPPLEEWRHFRYCDTADGNDIGIVDHAATEANQNLRAASASSVAHVSQPILEEALRARLAEESLCQCLFGRRLISIASGRKKATLDDGTVLEYTHLIGADGPRGPTRAKVGEEKKTKSTESIIKEKECISLRRIAHIGFDDASAPALQHFVSIHFESNELGKRLQERPAMLYFIFNSRISCVLVAHDRKAGIFNLQVPFFPPLDKPGDVASPGRVNDFIRAALQTPLSDLRLFPGRTWAMRARLEPNFCTKNKTIFIVGDAVHEMPPSGGFGLNTAVQDAHNLAWKLATAYHTDDSMLLDTYESERRPAAAASIAVAVDNWRRGLMVPAALGAPPAALNAARNICMPLPTAFFHHAFSFARTIAFSSPALQASRANLAELLKRKQDLPLFFPRIDLGARYDQDVIQAAKDALANARHPSGAEPYSPSFRPGHRLPHFFLPDGRPSLELVRQATEHGKAPVWPLILFGDFDLHQTNAFLAEHFACISALVVPSPSSEVASNSVDAFLLRPDGFIAAVFSRKDLLLLEHYHRDNDEKIKYDVSARQQLERALSIIRSALSLSENLR